MIRVLCREFLLAIGTKTGASLNLNRRTPSQQLKVIGSVPNDRGIVPGVLIGNWYENRREFEPQPAHSFPTTQGV